MSEDPPLGATNVNDLSEEFAQAIRWCLANRKSLNQTLRTLRESQLRGEPTQSELSNVLERCPNLRRVCFVAWQFDIESAVETAVANDCLEDEAGRQFLMWWGEQQWITDGLEAYLQSEIGTGDQAWTQTELRFRIVDDQLWVEYIVNRGVDELHTVCVPAEKLLHEAVWQSAGIVEKLTEAMASNDIDPDDDLVEQLEEQRDTLNEVASDIKTLEESIDVQSKQTKSSSDTESGDPDLEALFERAENESTASGEDDSMRGFY